MRVDADGRRTTPSCCSTTSRSKGFVERRRDPADRRRHIVAITDEGHEALQRAERAMESLEEEVFGGMSPEDREALRGLLLRALAEEPADQAAAA